VSDDVARITALAVAPRAELHERGRTERHEVRRRDHAEWSPPPDRRSPLDILLESNATREPDLVPIRYGRMVADPFSFFRGAPAVMAADLGPLPRTRIWPQICGDAHLSNFGVFGTPERSMILKACVEGAGAGTLGFQPEIVPSSLAKMKVEAPEAPAPSLTVKLVPPENTMPVGDPGTATTSACGVPSPS